MRQIEELSKAELLSLIYHNLDGGTVLYKVHPTECASCGTFPGYSTKVEGRDAKVYFYICNRCEDN